MPALTVRPTVPGNGSVTDVPEPDASEGSVLVATRAVARYVEHGIEGLHGLARTRWRADPDGLVRLHPSVGDAGVLLERHDEAGAQALTRAYAGWLTGPLTGPLTLTVPVEDHERAVGSRAEDVESVVVS